MLLLLSTASVMAAFGSTVAVMVWLPFEAVQVPPRLTTQCSNLSLDSFACGAIAMPCSEELALVVICSSSYSPSGEDSPESSRPGR